MKKTFLSLKLLLCALLLTAVSCGKQPELPKLPGVEGPFFNIVDGQLLITMNLLTINAPFGGKFPIPKTENSFGEIAPNVVSTGTTAQIYVDFEDMKKLGLEAKDPHTLPDGRALPGIPGGSLPSVAFQVDRILDTTFYFGQKLFGFFIPIKGFNTQGYGGYYPITINGQQAGLLGLVSSDENGENAGFTIFLKLDALKNPQLQKLIKLSKKYPNRVF